MTEQDKTPQFFEVLCTSPVNIAVIKYWGKRDEKLILPLNSSISVTLSQDNLKTKTAVFLVNKNNNNIDKNKICQRINANFPNLVLDNSCLMSEEGFFPIFS